MIKEFYECPDCFEQRVALVKTDDDEVYRCEACGHVYETQEWDDIHNYFNDEQEYYYPENEIGEIWDKLD